MKINEYENIIFESKSYADKIPKKYDKLIISSLFLIFFWGLLMWAFRFDNMSGSSFGVVLVILLVFTSFVGVSIYDTFWGYKKYLSDNYAITNKNVYLKHNNEEMKLSIYDIEFIGIDYTGSEYGSLYFFYSNKKKNFLSTSHLSLVGIKNPGYVAEKVIEINKDITLLEIKKRKQGGRK